MTGVPQTFEGRKEESAQQEFILIQIAVLRRAAFTVSHKWNSLQKLIKGAQSRLKGLKSLAKLFKFRCL